MEKNSEHLEFLKYREGMKAMSDVALAKSLIKDIGGGGQVATMIFNAYTTLSRMFPQSQWTARRLKSWWNQETENVLHREMRELYQAAQTRKAEQELIREARNEHKEFLAKTARIAALLERQDPDFYRPQIEAMGEQSRGMGRPGNQGD